MKQKVISRTMSIQISGLDDWVDSKKRVVRIRCSDFTEDELQRH